MRELHKHWKGILFRGFISLIFGLIALFTPALGFELLVLYFGAYCFVDGLVAFFVGIKVKSFVLTLEGIVGILVGAYIFFYTVQAAGIFLLLIAIWAIVSGIVELFAAVELRKLIKNEVWMVFVGLVSVIFGLFVFVNPIVSALAITFVIGIYALIFGLFLIALAMRVKVMRPSTPTKKKKKR